MSSLNIQEYAIVISSIEIICSERKEFTYLNEDCNYLSKYLYFKQLVHMSEDNINESIQLGEIIKLKQNEVDLSDFVKNDVYDLWLD